MLPPDVFLFLKPGAGGSGVMLSSGKQLAGHVKVTVSGFLPT
jgi:hypothetical protein